MCLNCDIQTDVLLCTFNKISHRGLVLFRYRDFKGISRNIIWSSVTVSWYGKIRDFSQEQSPRGCSNATVVSAPRSHLTEYYSAVRGSENEGVILSHLRIQPTEVYPCGFRLRAGLPDLGIGHHHSA